MNRTEGVVLMTREDFENFNVSWFNSDNCFWQTQNVIFDEDNEKDTDTDAETSIF